jgi:hypothetical protein
MAKKMNFFDYLAIILLLAGGINWLGVAFGWNFVEMLLGTMWAKLVYVLVGGSSIYSIFRLLTR